MSADLQPRTTRARPEVRSAASPPEQWATVETELWLRPLPPFDFAGTVHKPSNFPVRCVEYRPGTYWQTLRWRGEIIGVRLRNAGRRSRPRIRATLYSAHPLGEDVVDEIATELRWRLDLDANLTDFCERFRSDAVLGPALERWAGMRVSTPYSLYEYMVVAVVLQNTTVRRSAAMLNALFERYGTLVRFDGRELFAFWTPEEMALASDGELRALRVGYRAKALSRIAQAFAVGDVDENAIRRLDPEAAKRELLRLYGVGPASVWYLLFGVFHHYDAFDVVSPWEQKIYSRLFFGRDAVPAERILREARRRWGPWRMLASHYVFEDLFWQHKRQPSPWLTDLIRL